MENTQETPVFVAQEVAYTNRKGDWKRKICKTEASFDKLLDKVREWGGDIRVRNAD